MSFGRARLKPRQFFKPLDGFIVSLQSQVGFSEREQNCRVLPERARSLKLKGSFFESFDRDERKREKLPRLPPLRFGGRFEYEDERWLLGLEATRYDEQDDVAPYETETAGYLLLNADVRRRWVGVTGMELELFMTASNLGDDEARKHTSFVKDVAPLPGRNYTLGIRSRF